MRRLVKPVRIAVVMLLLGLVLTIYIVALYDLQVVQGEEWSSYAENNHPVTKTIEATRGKILDRNGTDLVSNRSVNNIVLDWDTLYYGIEEDTNDVLLSLVDLTLEVGYDYTDTLPISDSPFTYTEMSSTQRDYLEKYITYYEDDIRELISSSSSDVLEEEDDDGDGEDGAEETPDPDALTPDNVSAVQLMAFMRNEYNIKAEYTAEETRIIAGLRYEIDLRYIQIGESWVGVGQYIFAEDVGVDLITAVLERGYPGVEVQESSLRRYNTTTAAHILGRVGIMDAEDVDEYDYPPDTYVGKEGIEKDFEEYLHGTNGSKTQTVTSGGTVIDEIIDEEAEPGGNVITTLDSGMQAVAESALRTTMSSINAGRGANEDKADGGAVVVLDVSDGGVLTMASSPTFSIESYSDNFTELETDETNPLLNRATGGTYIPGSTYKMVVALAALYYGEVTEWETIHCNGKYSKYADQGYEPRCMGTHGDMDMRSAICNSCNVYFFELADRLGAERIAEMAGYLGFGELTGIGYGEQAGQTSTMEVLEAISMAGVNAGEVYAGDIIQIGIGQGADLCTPIQLANYAATIANGGVRYTPHLLKEVISYDSSEVLYTYEPEVAMDLTELDGMVDYYFTIVQEGMAQVSTQGTARSYFSDFMVTVASKTGTAETSDDEGGYEDGVFVCYAPVEDPQIAIAVVIENGGAGSDVIPVAKAILEYYFKSDEIVQEIITDNTLLY